MIRSIDESQYGQQEEQCWCVERILRLLPLEGDMEIFFADDSQQSGAREGMGRLVAFGGVFVPDSALRPLHTAIDGIAGAFGIPKGEELKWSPKKDSWIYKSLLGEDRKNCYRQVLQAA